jgi:hypothetical protein
LKTVTVTATTIIDKHNNMSSAPNINNNNDNNDTISEGSDIYKEDYSPFIDNNINSEYDSDEDLSVQPPTDDVAGEIDLEIVGLLWRLYAKHSEFLRFDEIEGTDTNIVFRKLIFLEKLLFRNEAKGQPTNFMSTKISKNDDYKFWCASRLHVGIDGHNFSTSWSFKTIFLSLQRGQ